MSTAKRISSFFVPLMMVMILMFFWNMCRNINDVLIPHLKRACQLTDLQSSFVQTAFFGAYFLAALPSGWYIQKKGYQAGMITGLLISAVGAFLFLPAAMTRMYPFFLLALFVMATGFTLLEVTASPYITLLGDPSGASSRLSVASAVGSLGSTIAPYLAAMMLLHEKDIPQAVIASFSPDQLQHFLSEEANQVKLPYLSLAVILLVVALVIRYVRFPVIQEIRMAQSTLGRVKSIFQFRHTLYGVLAEFFYVGAEVGIVSFIIRYARWLNLPGLTEKKAALFITAFMGLVLIGRLMGSYILKRFNPARVLVFCSGSAFVAVAISILSTGYLSLGCLSLVGFFTSIIYPIIFSLSMAGLGDYTKTASSVFILGIVGGAIIPPFMGYISDKAGIKYAFIVPLVCYIYLLFFAVKGHRMQAEDGEVSSSRAHPVEPK
jgi:FHS family L-fucose permease-like MFS transporter